MQKRIVACVAAIVILAALGILSLIVYNNYKEEHTPSTNVMDIGDYYSIPDGKAMIILDLNVYDRPALWRNGTAYLDSSTVKELYSKRFFRVEHENTVLYSTADCIYRLVPGSLECLAGEEKLELNYPAVEIEDNDFYISVDFLERCGISYRLVSNPNIVMISYSSDARLGAECATATQIRVSQSIKADILYELPEGERVVQIDGGGIRENGFVKVMSENGIRGYVLESALSAYTYEDPVLSDVREPEYTHLRYAGKNYLGWQLIYRRDSVDLLKAAVKDAPELTIVSPTWFFLNSVEGTFNSYADKEYVRAAHELELKVWAVLKNDSIEGVFDCSEDSHRLLVSSESRKTLIRNLLEECREYGIDGINVDLEMLKVDTGVYFIQFLRELSVECRRVGLVLSVDNYVPQNYNAYYDIAEQGCIVDYVVIMGYDEHYSGSEQAGSVSSLDWFTDAISNTLKKAEPEGVIMALPFYTRLWKEQDGKVVVSATYGMDEAEKQMVKAGAARYWRKAQGQYYCVYESEGATYMLWLENADSLKLKAEAVREGKLAGIAAWKLGDESAGTWTLLKETLEGSEYKEQ